MRTGDLALHVRVVVGRVGLVGPPAVPARNQLQEVDVRVPMYTRGDQQIAGTGQHHAYLAVAPDDNMTALQLEERFEGDRLTCHARRLEPEWRSV